MGDQSCMKDGVCCRPTLRMKMGRSTSTRSPRLQLYLRSVRDWGPCTLRSMAETGWNSSRTQPRLVGGWVQESRAGWNLSRTQPRFVGVWVQEGQGGTHQGYSVVVRMCDRTHGQGQWKFSASRCSVASLKNWWFKIQLYKLGRTENSITKSVRITC